MNEKEIILEQYKLYVELADKFTDRRLQMHRFYFSILAALSGVFSFLYLNLKIDINHLLFIFSILGFIICYIWHSHITTFRQLATLKWNTVQKIEKSLPIQPYTDEWPKPEPKPEDPKEYRKLTVAEKDVPKLLMGLFVLIFIGAIILQICRAV